MNALQRTPFFPRADNGAAVGLSGIGKKLKKAGKKLAKPKTLLKVAAVAGSAQGIYAAGGKAALKSAAKKSARKVVNRKLARYAPSPAMAVRAEQVADQMADDAASQVQNDFVEYTAQTMPDVYAQAYDAAETLEGLGEGTGNFVDTLTKAVKEIAPNAAALFGQVRLQQINIERAKKGLPPIKPEDVAGSVKVEAEAGPETRASIRSGVADGISKYAVPLGFFGVGLLVVLNKRNQRTRR